MDYRQKYLDIGIRVNPNDVRHSDSKTDSFNSRFPNLKAYQILERDYTFSSNPGAGDTTLITIPHGLPDRPASRANYSDSTGDDWYFFPWFLNSQGFSGMFDYWTLQQRIDYVVDDTNLIIKYRRRENPADLGGGTVAVPGGSGLNMNGLTFKFHIYLFADSVE